MTFRSSLVSARALEAVDACGTGIAVITIDEAPGVVPGLVPGLVSLASLAIDEDPAARHDRSFDHAKDG